MNKPILCLDFDGVCHSYTSGWKGADVISDDAVPGLFEFLEEAAPYFDIQVFSSRSNQPGGVEAMQFWFYEQRRKWRAHGGGDGFREIVSISLPTEKPAAFITIDDRAVTFTGTFPSVEFLRNFKPWNVGHENDLKKAAENVGHENDLKKAAEAEYGNFVITPVPSFFELLKQYDVSILITREARFATTIIRLAGIILDSKATTDSDRLEAEKAIESVLPLLG